MNIRKYISQMFTDLKITDIVQTVVVVLSFIIAWGTLQDWKNEKKFEIQTTLRSSIHNDFRTFSLLHKIPYNILDIDSTIIQGYNFSLSSNEEFYNKYPKVKPLLLRKTYYDYHLAQIKEEYKNLLYNANLANQLDESDGCPLTLNFYKTMYMYENLFSRNVQLLDLEMANFKLKNNLVISPDSLYNLITPGLVSDLNNAEISKLNSILLKITNNECQ